jgi:methylmalonyl-CoA/ethylmalonyl-CoA epimerase
MGHKVNHIAVAVANMEDALGFWRDAMGLELAHTKTVAKEQVRVGFLPIGDCEIELMEPTEEDSPVGKFLAKRGAGLHHICLEVEDIEASMEQLRQHGAALINETPQSHPEGTRYCFVHPKSTGGVLVELYELAKGV